MVMRLRGTASILYPKLAVKVYCQRFLVAMPERTPYSLQRTCAKANLLVGIPRNRYGGRVRPAIVVVASADSPDHGVELVDSISKWMV
jgi:hypothetical protein